MHSAETTWTLRAAARRALLATFCIACVTPLYADTPDAVIELWEQHWTLNADGSSVYYNKQHVRINSDRAYGEFADPRITYNTDTDKLEILVARVKRPDGSYVDAPDYAHVQVGPNGASGWPAFANITQHLVVLSGIEPGCVAELEYRITSRPGTRPYLAADLRLDHRYPVRRRKIVINTPQDVRVRSAVSGFPAGAANAPAAALANTAAGLEQTTSLEWTFADLPAVPDEPQSLPWQARCRRLAFTTARSADEWLADRLAQIDAAAAESDLIKKLADEWTKDADDQLEALQKKFAATFNFVAFDVSWQPAALRSAAEVVNSGYGLPAEAAATFLALARSAGLPAQPAIMVNDDVWTDEAPQDALVAAYVVTTSGADGAEIWHPQKGRVYRDAHWAGHTLLSNVAGKIRQNRLPPWTDPEESRCELRGRIDIAASGKYTGKLTLRTSGLFVPPAIRHSADRQRSRLQKLVRRLLPDAQVDKFTVTTLSPGVFEAEVQVTSDKKLDKVSNAYRLALAQDGPFMADVPLPLAYSRRQSAVRLTGAFDERIDLTIEWPAGWNADAIPASVAAARGDWGLAEQAVRRNERGIVLARHTRSVRRDLPADDWLALRDALNAIRSARARTLLLRP